ncbi:Dihydrolipoamide dehydrogenase of branched-chain alpha-keto acid dehydrogenase [Alkalibacterium sp. AK22]|uniref:dihydrolipoyl dehydrogenase n=1 Tax=Alkalibacterium sp. AK22 TaxID=1229520 RepID=UPI00044C7AEE|nr:dihydrolipoyl dehydrogenase [Alkalibacterium sp. AK22]EXJ23235.1 Dihydrolipoamide dehydrogenase of branched-chain alpha-keto acid dehydrogenase [Alkalibacterium sp. AK22]
MAIETDLLILGGGTGGYVAAIRAAQQGMKVVLVEKDKLGGTCLHRGCIPTKAYLRSAEVMDTLRDAESYGIDLKEKGEVNYGKVVSRKNEIVDTLHQGVKGLISKNKITYLKGKGAVLGPSIFSPVSGAVAVTFDDPDREEEIYVPKKLIIATGAVPNSLPTLPVDEEVILSSNGMFQLEALPDSMAIIGGGVIGVEWASMLNSLGVKVTVIEALDRLVINESEAVSKELYRQFIKRGINIELNQPVKKAEMKNGKVLLSLEEAEEVLTVDKVLTAIGRRPVVDGLGLQNTSVKYTEKGIVVNSHYQTSESHIYAIGDCIDTMQLAHVAMKEGELAVEHIVKNTSEPLAYHNVPRCTYTSPEIASVGYIRETVPEGRRVKIGTFSFGSNGKALINGNAEGLVEIIRDETSDDLLGVSVIGPHATELISEVSTAIYMDASPIELGEAIHPHPTLSEAIQEAALDTYKSAIHK